jgi:hypothetical protein
MVRFYLLHGRSAFSTWVTDVHDEGRTVAAGCCGVPTPVNVGIEGRLSAIFEFVFKKPVAH